METILATIANEVVQSLLTNTITEGVSKILKKSPEEKAAKALEKALNKIAVDNEFWKKDVLRHPEVVINILVRKKDNPNNVKLDSLPPLLRDEKLLDTFYDCLKEDRDTFDYLNHLVSDYIQRDTRDIASDTNMRVRKMEEKLDGSSNLPDCHFLTPTPPKANSTNVIGRTMDLQTLWNTLVNKQFVMLKGFGGIGKTRLAQLLFHEYENEFKEVGWIDYRGNLKKSFLTCINAPQFQSDNKSEDERWNFMESVLYNDGKRKLFIVDNVDSEGEQHPKEDKLLQELTGWNNTTVLLTSRMTSLEDFQIFDLGYLSKEDCIVLFNRYYEGEDANLEVVTKLVELAGLHTLTIELLAKGAWQEENLGAYYEKVKSSFEEADEKVRTKHHNEEDTIVHHLQYLFNMQKRDEKEIKVLQGFAILPVNCECTKKELEDWFGFNKSDWSALIQDGWLKFDSNRKVYSLHPLVRTIVRFDFIEDENKEKSIAPQGTADKILDYFWHDGKWFKIDNGYVSLQRIIGIVETARGAVAQEESERFGSLFHRLGYIYDDLGDYDTALDYYEKALAIREKVLGTEHPDTATTYNNIGLVYDNKGDYDNALEYYFMALPIREKVLGTEHLDTAITYNNIGSVYWARGGQGDYDNALKYYEKVLVIKEKVLGTEHTSTATTYNNVGTVYFARGGQGDYDNALKYHEKALTIFEKVLGTEHPSTATIYNNIAGVYDEKGDYDNALDYYEKALKIDEKVLGKDHPNTATDYNNIGSMYYQMGNYPEAKKYLEKALQIRKTKLGDDHPYTKQTQEWIDATKAAMLKGK